MFRGDSESGESRPARLAGYESTLILPWRLGGSERRRPEKPVARPTGSEEVEEEEGFGAMGIGAVLAMALGLDMVPVKRGKIRGSQSRKSRFTP